ncbi:hypothetical protein M5689_003082 [Euphorbia peplus]|nr:hypothetical protein M5689_003082 [Euphorbia peplus]
MRNIHTSLKKLDNLRNSSVFDTVCRSYVVVEEVTSSSSEQEENIVESPTFSHLPKIGFPSEDHFAPLPLAMIYPESEEGIHASNRYDILVDMEEKDTDFYDNLTDTKKLNLLMWVDEVGHVDKKKTKKQKAKDKQPEKNTRLVRERINIDKYPP